MPNLAARTDGQVAVLGRSVHLGGVAVLGGSVHLGKVGGCSLGQISSPRGVTTIFIFAASLSELS